MKKLSIIALAAVMAAGASAANSPAAFDKLPQRSQPSKQYFAGVNFGATNQLPEGADKLVNAVKRSTVGAPIDGFPSVEDLLVPTGRCQNYTYQGTALLPSIYQPYPGTVDGFSQIYYDGDKVYMNCVVDRRYGYVEGTLKSDNDGNKYIEIQLPQLIESIDYTDTYDFYYDTWLSYGTYYTYTANGSEYVQYRMEDENPDNVITFDIRDDGTVISGQDLTFPKDANGEYYMPERVLSTFSAFSSDPDDKSCNFDCPWTMYYFPFNYEPAQVPEGVEVDPYWLLEDLNGQAQFFDIAIDEANQEVYMSGWTNVYTSEKHFIKGKIVDGNKMVFQSPQWLYFDQSRHVLFFVNAGKIVKEYNAQYGQYIETVKGTDEDGNKITEITLDYDAEKKQIKAQKNGAFVLSWDSKISDETTIITWLQPTILWKNPEMLNGPIADPSFYKRDDQFYSMDGSTGFIWYVFPMTQEFQELPACDVWFNFYLNKELFRFYDDEYALGGEKGYVTNVPLDFEGNINMWFDPSSNQLVIYVYAEGIENVGLQLFHQGTDQVYSSALVEQSFTGALTEAFQEGKTVSGVEYFDLEGRRLNAPKAGINMQRTSFADGTVTSTKVVVR